MSSIESDSRIIVVGAGVFGLSTALWLARAGYRDITVIDMQDVSDSGYDPGNIDSASADLNKIIRFSYGSEIQYQKLATEAATMWNEWNQHIHSLPDSDLPVGLRGSKTGLNKLWYNCGMVRMSLGRELGEFELQTLKNMEKEGIRDTQFRSDDPSGE